MNGGSPNKPFHDKVKDKMLLNLCVLHFAFAVATKLVALTNKGDKTPSWSIYY
jgi:hypothetical protein